MGRIVSLYNGQFRHRSASATDNICFVPEVSNITPQRTVVPILEVVKQFRIGGGFCHYGQFNAGTTFLTDAGTAGTSIQYTLDFFDVEVSVFTTRNLPLDIKLSFQIDSG